MEDVKHYLGPNVGPLALASWDQIVSAAEGGLLEETQWCELKQMLPPSNKKTNIELAKDLASLSVHGGVLILGVVDKTLQVTGCPVEGVRDRISQVADMGICPSLSPVIGLDLRNPDDESKSVLVVQVPASGLAPHMVEGKYWGRSPNGKAALGDAEVRELMRNRSGTSEAFKQRLTALVTADPMAGLVDDNPTELGTLYLVAEPCAPALVRDHDFRLSDVTNELSSNTPIGRLYYQAPDPLGQAISSHRGRATSSQTDHVGHLLVRQDDHSLEAVFGGATWIRPDESYGIRANFIAGTVIQFYELIKTLSLEQWGYTGQWRVGIHIAALADAVMPEQDWADRETVFARESYSHQETTSPAAWDEVEPEARKLLAGFLRGISRSDWTLNELKSGRKSPSR